jgi:hypothetical protein
VRHSDEAGEGKLLLLDHLYTSPTDPLGKLHKAVGLDVGDEMGSRGMMAERAPATYSHATIGTSMPQRIADAMRQVEVEVGERQGAGWQGEGRNSIAATCLCDFDRNSAERTS